jgi:arylsulfatase A-like enzyme
VEVPFLVSGAGFRRGLAPENPSIVDVAPTIAALLGVAPPDDVEGRVLTEVLGSPSPPARAGRAEPGSEMPVRGPSRERRSRTLP